MTVQAVAGDSFTGSRRLSASGVAGVNQNVVFDELDEGLTNSSKVAASLGDEFLVYLIDMAVLHVRKKAIHLEDNAERRLQNASHTQDAMSECA